MTGTALVPCDDINKAITDLKASLCGLDPPAHRARQCARMSELHDRINAGLYRDIIGEAYVCPAGAKRVGVKASDPRAKAGKKAAHEWITEWHGYSKYQQDNMLREARNPEGFKAKQDKAHARSIAVTSVISLYRAIERVYDRSSSQEQNQIKDFGMYLQSW